MALRGLRPIAEIQYLDYVLYCLHTLSDDLASYLYRTVGQQAVPLIIRTRGHRLEGIWVQWFTHGRFVALIARSKSPRPQKPYPGGRFLQHPVGRR